MGLVKGCALPLVSCEPPVGSRDAPVLTGSGPAVRALFCAPARHGAFWFTPGYSPRWIKLQTQGVRLRACNAYDLALMGVSSVAMVALLCIWCLVYACPARPPRPAGAAARSRPPPRTGPVEKGAGAPPAATERSYSMTAKPLVHGHEAAHGAAEAAGPLRGAVAALLRSYCPPLTGLVQEQVKRSARTTEAHGADTGAAPDVAQVGQGPGHGRPMCCRMLRDSWASVLVRAVWRVHRRPVSWQGALIIAELGASPPRQRSRAGGGSARGSGAAPDVLTELNALRMRRAARTACAAAGAHARPSRALHWPSSRCTRALWDSVILRRECTCMSRCSSACCKAVWTYAWSARHRRRSGQSTPHATDMC